jgi:hypothetical protein
MEAPHPPLHLLLQVEVEVDSQADLVLMAGQAALEVEESRLAVLVHQVKATLAAPEEGLLHQDFPAVVAAERQMLEAMQHLQLKQAMESLAKSGQ